MKLTVSYGLIPPNEGCGVNSHILPITKVMHPVFNDKPYFLTCGRDGSVVLHRGPRYEQHEGMRMQVHSDWVSDIIEVGKNRFVTVSHDFSIVLLVLNDDLDSWQMQIVGDHDDYIKCVVPLHHEQEKAHLLMLNLDMQATRQLSMSDDEDQDEALLKQNQDQDQDQTQEQKQKLEQEQAQEQAQEQEQGRDKSGAGEQDSVASFFHFATGSLDKTIKIWQLDNLSNTATLLHTFDNSQDDDMGSIYAMAALNRNDISHLFDGDQLKEKVLDGTGFTENEVSDTDSNSDHSMDLDMPFDLVVGDCNGNLIFYSSEHYQEYTRLKNAHMSNIKVLKVIDNSSKLISTCSDGVIQLWDLDATAKSEDNVPVNIGCWKWNATIWCITGTSHDELYFGDSKGKIVKLDLTNYNDSSKDITMDVIFDKEHHKAELSENDIKVQSSKRQKGILDLICLPSKCLFFSFCTDSNMNIYNMITEELKVKKGGFALTRSSLLTNRRHVITENTKNEIQRWDILNCTLLDTFTPEEGTFDEVVMKYTSKEILSHWCTVSVKVGMLFVKINDRFTNTEIYGSALENYELMNKISLNQDERYNLGKIVVNSLFFEFISYELDKDKIWRKKLVSRKKEHPSVKEAGSNSESQVPPVEKSRDKWKKSAFNKFLGSSSNSNSNNGEPLDLVTENENSESEAYDTPPLSPSQGLNDKTLDEVIQPTAHKNFGGRTLSSGSLLGRKFKSFRSGSTKNNSNTNNLSESCAETPIENGERDQSLVPSHNVSGTTTKDGTPDLINWNHPFKGDSSKQNAPSHSNIAARLQATESSRSNSVAAADSFIGTPLSLSSREEFMSDLMDEIHESYQKTHNANTSSIKLLARKPPDSKIRRDLSCPIVKIERGCLLLVHNWKEGACGGRVVFSTYIPIPRSEEEQEEGLKKIQTEEEDDNAAIDEDKLKKYDYVDNDDGNVLSRRELFELLETNLPYWLAKILLTESKKTEGQPKLSFTIIPWTPGQLNSNNETLETDDDGNTQSQTESSTQSHSMHNMLKFGKSKSNDHALTATDLPKISELNMKLMAPGMIKVKKIKLYVVDRFESKTPEMKAKQNPNDWLELLCKGQVLDNDMTLSTVRSLFWKSQGDIVLQYRRKL
ncbi:uncharacterized protein HLK63_I03311 [Nakaseomyces glabratus]|nr:hypothetical protein LTX96_0003585 [Nakaseomyces glabratus]UCS21385.1 uncharacterized protein GW608_I03311 [Nakaseomyces glabratus]UCS26616.1 uncharacterized protein HLK63_I03311 [Nakaseomyces glabratus]UCS31846.1 uncharacterized protein HLK64_I03311 [Nakaseomyces glabratus]UCS37074.1 uncharacterized protein HLK62_I03311 [Nakaseomyces glabratus]